MTPAEYVTAIKTFLSTNIGVTSIRHPDGRQVTLDRKQAMQELAFWERRASGKAVFGRSRIGLKGDA